MKNETDFDNSFLPVLTDGRHRNGLEPVLASGSDIHRNHDERQLIDEMDWEEYLEYIDNKDLGIST